MIKNNLKKLRGNRTQAEAAAALDMSQGVYSMMESGRAVLNKCELVKAMTYYDVPAEKIYPPDILRLCFGIDAAEKKRKPTEKGETMSKYVNVDAFVEALCKTLSTLRKQKDNTPESIAFLKGAQVVAKELMKFPAADVAPVVHGRWICINKRYGEYECSVCHGVDANCSDYYGIHAVTEQEFCPNCGAKMDKEETNELDKR